MLIPLWEKVSGGIYYVAQTSAYIKLDECNKCCYRELKANSVLKC